MEELRWGGRRKSRLDAVCTIIRAKHTHSGPPYQIVERLLLDIVEGPCAIFEVHIGLALFGNLVVGVVEDDVLKLIG